MSVIAALCAGLLAGWAFARGRSGRWAYGALAGLLAAGAAAVVAAVAGDEPAAGVALGVAAGAWGMRRRQPQAGLEPRGPVGAGAPHSIILALLLLRLGVALGGGLPLSADEAQYWDWSRSLDWAYYSKPGGIAWLIAGWSAVAGDSLIALRLLGVLLAAATLAITWRIARRLSDAAGAWMATALAALLPLHALSAGLITTDVPLVLCWVGFLAVLLRTPAAGGSAAWWHAPALGALLAAGCTAKYAMLYAPLAIAVAACTLPQLRTWLRTPTPWLALAIGLLGMWPVLWWNAQHGWVGVLHLAAQSGFGRTMSLRPFEFLASQLAVGLPVSLLLPWAVRWAWRQRAARPAAWLLACAALTPLAVLLGASMQAKVQANWAALSWIPAALLVACWLPHAGTAWPRRVLFGGAALALLAAVLISAAPALRQRFPALPPSVPERKLAGWDELATAVASSLAAQPERTVILTAGYDVAAQLAWHNRELPRPLCANFGRRMNQYDLWQQLDETRSGWDALFVSEIARDDALDGDLLARLPAGLRDDFAGAAPPRLLRIAYGGRSWRCFLIVRLRGFDGRLDSARTISSW